MSIFFQDIKERSVYWFLFLIVACTAGYLYYTQTFLALFWRTSIINIGVISMILLVLQTYAKLKLKTDLKNVFGLGDALLFLGLCVAFPIASFIIFFVFSLLFSLILHFVLKNRMQENSIPLAGYMSLFFISIYLFHWTGFIPNLYNI
ncbi:hypothetical protein [Kordia sp.]|uniref:hypothetical protein n=1 Tax=Kordia sp. TaxID=1965332 RepID=UPI003B5A4C9A